MIGYGALCVVHLLKANGLLKPESPVRNLSLVLAMLVKFARKFDGHGFGDEAGGVSAWVKALVKLAEQSGVPVEGLTSTQSDLSNSIEVSQKEKLWYFCGSRLNFTKPTWKSTVCFH